MGVVNLDIPVGFLLDHNVDEKLCEILKSEFT